jgi:hypothetical protein
MNHIGNVKRNNGFNNHRTIGKNESSFILLCIEPYTQDCHLMKSKKRKTLLKIRKKADKKAEIYILTRFYDF